MSETAPSSSLPNVGLQKTILGEFPSDWQVTNLGGISSLVTSGSRDWSRFYSETGAVFVRIGNLTREHINLRWPSVIYVRPPSTGDGQRTRLEAGDLLISITADLGIVAIVPQTLGESYINQHIALVRLDPLATNSRFIGHFLSASRSQKHFQGMNDAGAKAGLNLPAIRSYPVIFPSRPEQDKIAVILDTLDTAIQRTEAIIGKLRQVKQGLLHDLLTRGIDANGDLRPSADEAPDLYQDSPVGRIPKAWKLDLLVSRVDFPQGQVDPRHSPYREWTLVAPDHIESGTGTLLNTQTAQEQGAISGKYLFEAGDIIYSKIRPYLRKAILAEWPGLCSADMYPLRPKLGNNPKYLHAVILGEQYSKFAEAVSMRSGFPKINRNEMGEYWLGWAPEDEQNGIAQRIQAIESKQANEGNHLSKLKTLKSGLMDDLLTGRVRVTALRADGA